MLRGQGDKGLISLKEYSLAPPSINVIMILKSVAVDRRPDKHWLVWGVPTNRHCRLDQPPLERGPFPSADTHTSKKKLVWGTLQ